MTAPPVDRDAGEWIAEHVLTRTYIASCGGLELVRTCACQYGTTQHCTRGNHNRCGHTTHPEWYAHPRQGAETYLIGRRGGALADVYITGPACMPRCPCSCHARPPAPDLGDADALIPLAAFGRPRARQFDQPKAAVRKVRTAAVPLFGTEVPT